ncbi:unnamed protein product [Clavelina lepadiformis]|uniref:Ammonium transporter AmtB-like domain-containing protein n=1 Tax=Clavelina lepadiformis TaxID=159417 RepID=A0ABP0GBF4_CLALP
MRGKLSLFLLVPEVIFIILFGVFVQYDEKSGPSPINGTSSEEFHSLYPMFQDVHVMIFVGFGFLMTFLKRYGFGSVGFNLMLAAFVIQWAIIMRGCLDRDDIADGKIDINLESLLNADFACGAVLISFGAVLGVLSPVQLVVMAILEIVCYAVNEFVIISLLQISDIGGSMVIHAFGAYFGLAVSLLHWRKELENHHKEGTVYQSDIFAMIGTLFLFLFWPSFNAAPAAGTFAGERAVINTLYSLSAATVMSFALSSAVDKDGKLSMVHIQNATLAGGVAAGSVANLRVGPLGALIVGASAGALSTVGYKYITPALQRTFKLHDTCGVHNLHGMPGVLSGLAAVVFARYSSNSAFRDMNELESIYPGFKASGFDFQQQANMQIAGLAVTLGISIVGGLLTGLLLRAPFLDKLKSHALFDDDKNWLVDDDDTNTTSGGSGIAMAVIEEPRQDEVKENLDRNSTDGSVGSSLHEQMALAT